MSCPCDRTPSTAGPEIQAGLVTIPRQKAGFPEFRRAMLSAIRNRSELAAWSGRGEGDLGLMLLEMWAYVCDCLSFYDETIAHECYLRTARLSPSVRKLVALLGYLPLPARAAEVYLALLADGRQAVKVPKGATFRSGAFDSEPPQVFETSSDALVHPFFNNWSVSPTRRVTVGVSRSDGNEASTNRLKLEPGSVTIKAGDVALVTMVGGATKWASAGKVESVETMTGSDGEEYQEVTFDSSLGIPLSGPVATLKLLRATQKASVFKLGTALVFARASRVDDTDRRPLVVHLDGIYRQIKPGQYVVVQNEAGYHPQLVQSVEETPLTVYTSGGTNATMTVTCLTLDDGSLGADPSQVVIHYAFAEGGAVSSEMERETSHASSLVLTPRVEETSDDVEATSFLLKDRNNRGIRVSGTLDSSESSLKLGPDENWDPPLTPPVTVFGNVVLATRGETVENEVLGSGDASAANQSFKLAKKPLTWLREPGAPDGLASTLRVHVAGIRWGEVRSFFGTGPQDEVYVTRQDDEAETFVTFGDGVRGARLSTGSRNVVASYRYGAGASAPPAGSITQPAKPVKGIKSVKNPVAAGGGADAEPASGIRVCAPRSALTLGRAVSIKDMEAIVARVAGVRAVRAEWIWNPDRRRTGVMIWYIGDPGPDGKDVIVGGLQAVADPAVLIDAQSATPEPVRLELGLELDRRHVAQDVFSAVRDALLAPGTGLLSPERVGIGEPLFRSQLLRAATTVPGVVAVRSVSWTTLPADLPTVPVDGRTVLPLYRRAPLAWEALAVHRLSALRVLAAGRILRLLPGSQFLEYAKSPGPGRYFNFAQDRLKLDEVSSGK